MNDERELSEILERARVRTSPDQDERILGAAGTALPRRWPMLFRQVAAAAALVAIVLAGWGIRGDRDRVTETADLAVNKPAPAAGPASGGIAQPTGKRFPEAGRPGFPRPPEESKPDDELTLRLSNFIPPNQVLKPGDARAPDYDVEVPAGLPPVTKNRPPNRTLLADPAVDGLKLYGERERLRVQIEKELRIAILDHANKGPDLTQWKEWKLDLVSGDKKLVAQLETLEKQWDHYRRFELNRLPGSGEDDGRSVDLPRAEGAEDYASLPESPFFDPRREPLSTFSIDVDTASYANVRRFLMSGRLPPPAAVRVEEMVNYFRYAYPQPAGEHPFSTSIEVTNCPWRPGHRLVRVGLRGKEIPEAQIPPRNLVFLLDVSGSMRDSDKLPLVKSAMKLLAGTLRPEDHVSIVVYASNTRVALEPTSGRDRPSIISAIDALRAGGSTNGEGGIRLAYEMARRNFREDAVNRVMLATDGDFNVGETSQDGLLRLIEKEREGGIFLTVLGVGTGNLKDSRVEMLADAGNGNYHYLDSILEAQKVLVREAGGTIVTIAKDVKIQVEFNPAQVGAYRLVGYENRALSAADFNDDTKDAGEIGAGHTVTALYEIVPPGETEGLPVVDPLRYQNAPVAPEVNEEHSEEILTLKLRYKLPKESESRLLERPLIEPEEEARASEDTVFASAVACFGMLLRRSESAKALSFELVEELARGAVGEDPHGDRAEFVKLVELAGALAR